MREMKLGKYSVHDDPKVDECIDRYLGRVVEAILEGVSGVRSIILAGSYGKGEGSVLVDGQTIKPLRDFDLCVIFKGKVPSRDSIKKMQKRLQERFSSIKNDDYYLMGNTLPEIGATTLENINSLPDISTYDLKKCQVIYGEDVRSKIKWDLKDLPLRTNARALFQKAIALIGVFRTNYLNEEIPPHLKDSFFRETSRAYIEIGVGLCLLAKRYNSSSVRRLETLREIYRKEFPDLYERVPDLVNKIEASTKYKLDPTNNKLNVNLLDYWFETRDNLGEAIKYYYSRYLHIPFENWQQFSISLERGLTKEYYLPVVKAFLTNRNLPTNHFFSNLFNLLFNIKENVEYSGLAIRNRRISMPLLYGIASPTIKVFSTAPLILFSINHDGSMNSDYVNMAQRKLGFVESEKKHENPWEEARAKFLEVVFSVNMI
jgi:predicted nucleotidyltransferase